MKSIAELLPKNEKVTIPMNTALESGKIAFNAHYKNIHNFDYTGWNEKTLTALNEIINKIKETVRVKNESNLMIELDWFFYAAHKLHKIKPELLKDRFNPIYLNEGFPNVIIKLKSIIQEGKRVGNPDSVIQRYNELKSKEN